VALDLNPREPEVSAHKATLCSPITLAEVERLKQTLRFGPDDERWLRESRPIRAARAEALLDRWYAFIARLPHLGAYSLDRDGKPHLAYRAAARACFADWIRATTGRPFDQAWLDQQHEIGWRHHRAKKSRTDGVDSAPHIPLRYILAQAYTFPLTIQEFLLEQALPGEVVVGVSAAWQKAVLLQVIRWSYPYLKDGDF
jgi:hypothetical protein